MKKTLIASAVAALIAAPAAFADNATVYGKLHVSIDHRGDSNGATAGGQDDYVVDSNASRLGFKGSEDLGNGLKAIWQMEFAVSVSDNGGIGSNRNTYLGLSGNWGTFLAGRHDTPNKVAFYAAGNEHLGDSIVDLNELHGFTEVRIDDAIAYISPSFNGFTLAAAIVPGESTSAANADGLADAYSLGAMYGGNGIKAGVGYTNVEDYLNATGDAEMWNVGISYTMNGFTIGAQYQDQEAGNDDTEVWALVGKYQFGNNAIIASYGEIERDNAGTETDADNWGIALQHTLSKRTSAYIAYAGGDDTPVQPTWNAAAGLGVASSKADDDWSIGMIHSF